MGSPGYARMKAAPARRTGRSSWRICAGPSESVGLFLGIGVRVAGILAQSIGPPVAARLDRLASGVRRRRARLGSEDADRVRDRGEPAVRALGLVGALRRARGDGRVAAHDLDAQA